MTQTGTEPHADGLSFYLTNPTVKSYRSFAIAISRVGAYNNTNMGMGVMIAKLEYFCLDPVSFDLVCDGSQWQIPPGHTCYAMT